jgi:hypothetical protein
MATEAASLPDYWLPQPPMPLDAETRRACDEQLAQALAHGSEDPFPYTLSIPKWQFLCYIATEHGIALHGSSQAHIARFEPRQSIDLEAFGAQKAVYAAADGIWPLYYAIVDRAKSPTLNNSCIWLEEADGTLSQRYYFFSISRQAIDQQPYRDGMLYLLPSATFMRQPPMQIGSWLVHTAQLASLEAVTPLAKLVITPADFPFLAQMRTHDDDRLAEYGRAMLQGLPLPD